MAKIYSGEMTAQVEFFENQVAKNSSGEAIDTRVSLGKRHVKRLDAVGSEDADGSVLGLSVCRFQMRYEPALALKASTLEVDDFDGTWSVIGPMVLLDGRRRYMEIKCRKRGED